MVSVKSKTGFYKIPSCKAIYMNTVWLGMLDCEKTKQFREWG